MKQFKVLQEETTFFNDNGNVMQNRQEFSTSEVNKIHLAIDTGNKKDCAIIILNKNYDLEHVFQTTNDSTKEELEKYYTDNKSLIIEKLLEFQTYLMD